MRKQSVFDNRPCDRCPRIKCNATLSECARYQEWLKDAWAEICEPFRQIQRMQQLRAHKKQIPVPARRKNP